MCNKIDPIVNKYIFGFIKGCIKPFLLFLVHRIFLCFIILSQCCCAHYRVVKLYEVLDQADEMRNIMARGAMNAIRNNEEELDLNNVNDELFKLAKEVVTFYMEYGVTL